MREIKFRVFNEKKEEMYYWEGTGLGQAKPHWIKNKTKIMQFVGLKDKNGKEIYEGDILKIIYFKPIGRGHRWIEWVYIIELEFDEGFGYRFIRRDIKREEINLKEIDIKKEYNIFKDDLIIGNVHENPELLEEGI